MSGVVDEIKTRADLVELIGRSVPLKRSGSSYRGLCPFHQEKTPSFYVLPGSHTWVCFGCGKKGSAFDWLMEREHLDFGEALRSLAQLTGVALPDRRNPDTDERTRRLSSLLERAQAYYAGLLWGTSGAAARAPTCSTVVPGRADVACVWRRLRTVSRRPAALPPERRLLGSRAGGRRHAGHADDGRLYDFFRGRVVFPIRDAHGRTIAFGGRALEGASPKYLNSRESPLFHKQETLFALDLARQAIAHARRAVVVEGYLDALMAHQHGFRNVVATLGTAVTDRHLRQLGRSIDEIVLALDTDAAGQAATWRALQVAEQSLRSGLAPAVSPNRHQRRYVPAQLVRLRILTLPGAKDPDELIRADPSQWPALVQAARPVVDFVLDGLASRHDLATAQGKAAAADEAVALLDGIGDPIEQAHYVQRVALVLHVHEGAVRQALRHKQRTARPGREIAGHPNDPSASPPEGAEGQLDDEYVLALILRLRELDPHADFGELDFDVDESHVLLRAIRAGEPIHPELQPRFQRVQRQRELVEAFAVAQLQRELELKRLEHRRRALQQHQAFLHQHLREAATAAERIELGPALTQVAHEISRIDEALRKPRSTFAVNGGDEENAAARGHPGVERQAES